MANYYGGEFDSSEASSKPRRLFPQRSGWGKIFW